jgi:hypothetical protein
MLCMLFRRDMLVYYMEHQDEPATMLREVDAAIKATMCQIDEGDHTKQRNVEESLGGCLAGGRRSMQQIGGEASGSK